MDTLRSIPQSKTQGRLTATPSTCWTWATALDNCQVPRPRSANDDRFKKQNKTKPSCSLTFLPTLYFFPLVSAGPREPRDSRAPPPGWLRPLCGAGRGGWQPGCRGQRSSQAGRRSPEPPGPHLLTYLPRARWGACRSPSPGTQIQGVGKQWRDARGT